MLLREVSLADAEQVFEYASDPEVMQYLDWSTHRTMAETADYISGMNRQYQWPNSAPWGIEYKAERRLIGTCGFYYWNLEHSRAEIGYVLCRRYWGQGYATEAVRSIIAFGFYSMSLNRIEARCRTENLASARVMEKAGMQFEGVLRQQMFIKNAYRDYKMYSILRDEFADPS